MCPLLYINVLVDEVEGKPCNFEACLRGSLYSTFTTSFYPYAFITNGYKRFSKTNSIEPRLTRFEDNDDRKLSLNKILLAEVL